MRLTNDPEYFDKEVKLDGVTFQLRGLDKAAKAKVRACRKQLAVKTHADQLFQGEHRAEAARLMGGAPTPENRQALEALFLTATDVDPLDMELQAVVDDLNEDMLNLVIGAGVVGWDLKDKQNQPIDCPANRLLLPTPVKVELAPTILALSDLTGQESAFS
jgi:hypothetical protein